MHNLDSHHVLKVHSGKPFHHVDNNSKPFNIVDNNVPSILCQQVFKGLYLYCISIKAFNSYVHYYDINCLFFQNRS